jgi:hypothetical protein
MIAGAGGTGATGSVEGAIVGPGPDATLSVLTSASTPARGGSDVSSGCRMGTDSVCARPNAPR